MLYFIMYSYLFMIGSIVGSFINVVIDRLPKGETFVFGRSNCRNCHHVIRVYDLIPIISYILLKGKCRDCKCKIGLNSLFVEIFGGVMILFCFHHYGLSYEMVLSFLMFMVLLAISMIDIKTMIIPDRLTISFLVLSLIYSFFQPHLVIQTRLLGMISVSGIMLVMSFVVSNSFGGGDMKLMAVSGFLLGWQNNVLALLLAVWSAGIYAIYLLITKRKSRKDHIPFGPYLSFGIAFTLLYGNDVLKWYWMIV